jgi:hypothetical protein
MGFTKQKTITVSADDFIQLDAVCYAEFEHEAKYYLVQVVPDMDAVNPREDFDHEWTWTTTQNAGYSDSGAMRLGYWHDMEKAEREKYIAYPLSLLRHSGDTVYVGKNEHWSDPGGWDSGCMGIAYIPKKKAVQVWGSKYKNGEIVRQGTRLTKKVKQRAFECLKAEVAEMNAFLHNDVYGVMFTCLETEEDYESCWGFYCDDRDEMCRHVKEVLPAGMADEELNAVIESLEWKW